MPAITHSTRIVDPSGLTEALGFTTTASRVLVAVWFGRDGFGAPADYSGWTLITTGGWFGSFTDGIAALAKDTAGGETTIAIPTWQASGDRTVVQVYEISGAAAADIFGVTFAADLDGNGHVDGSITPTAGDPVLMLAAASLAKDGGTHDWSVSAGWTVEKSSDEEGAGGTHHPLDVVASQVVASPAGAYSVTLTQTNAEDYYFFLIMLAIGGTVTPPPTPEPGVFTDAGVELTDVISWTIQRGGSAEITGGAQIGTATIVVQNNDNQYDPENPAGILYPDLRDGLGIWIGINDDGHSTGSDAVGLFAGRVKDITLIPSPGHGYPATAEIVCEDPLGWYGRTPVNLPSREGLAQGALRLLALQAAGETRYDLAHEITTLQLAGAEGNLLGVLEDINRANGTRHFVKPGDNFTDWYTYTTRNRQWRLDGTADASVDSTDHDDISGWRFSADTVTNQQKATTTPIRFTPATVEVWKLKQQSVGISGRHKFDTWIDFDDYVRNPTVDTHYSGNTPSITLTSFGNRAHLVLQNTNIGHATRFDKVTIEGALARRLPDESYVADDTDSQALPRGIRAGSDISGQYVGTLPSAKGIAEHVVWRYSEVQLRPTLTMQNWFPDMFTLDLYDTIAFTSTHLDVAARLFEIVGLTHTSDVATPAGPGPVHHTVQYVLQECRVQSDPGWFTLDSSHLDGADVLAY